MTANPNSFILYVIDTETTGTDAKTQDIIEVSAMRMIQQEDESFEKEQKNWLIKAMNPSTIDDIALQINGHKREDILHQTQHGKDNYLEAADVIAQLELWIMEDGFSAVDRVYVGQNPLFDLDFLKEYWKRVGSPDTFPFDIGNNNRILDTKELACFIDVCLGRRRLYYNLGSLVKSFGVKKDKAHTADGDVRMTADLFLKFVIGFIKAAQANFQDSLVEKE